MWSERPGAWARTAGPGLSVPAKARVLLVGAAAVDQAALDSALAGLDVTIQVTSDEEALQQVEVDDLAAIVLMDGADGLALARRLRSLGSSATPLLFVIDEAAGWPLAEAYALGAVDHVTRPLVPGVVRSKLAFLVEHFQQARRLRSRADGRDEDDAKERARAEAELRASEQRLRLATEAAGLGIWVWHLADNRVTWENDRLYEIFGLLRSDEPVDATHFMADFVHPDDAASFERAMAATLKTGAPFYFLGRFRRKDGELRWTELTGQLVAEDDATPVHVLGTAADVTDDKRADDEIRRVAAESAAVAEANAKFRVFFEQGTQFAGVMTLDGTVVEVNRLCLEACGYHREEVIGKPFWECGWWNRSPALMERIHEASMQAAQGRLFRTETHYFIADGSQRHIDLILAPVTGEDGRVLFVAPSGTDITDRKRAERALRTSEERLRFLDALAEATRAAADPGDIMAMTTRLLGQHLAVTRTAYADVDADSDRFTIRNDWTVEGAASAAGVYSLDLFGPRAAADMRSGHTLVVCDVDGELEPAEGREMFNAIGVKAIVCCPLVKGERLVAMMAVHHARPRDWLSDEVALVEEVVERSWAHIERVRDAAALREKDQRLKLLVENIKDYAVIICDLEGKVIEWQGGAERITGFTAAEAVGGGAEIIFTAEDRAAGRPEGEMNRAARDGRAEDRRWHVRKDGSRFFADGVMIGLCDEAAQLHGFGKVFKDATGEAIAEESRRRHTEQLRTLADVSNRLNSVLDLGSVLGVVTEEGRALIGAHQAITNIAIDGTRSLQAVALSDALRGADATLVPPDRSAIYPAIAATNEPVRLTQDQLRAHAGWSGFALAAEGDPAMRGLLAAPIVARGGGTLGVIALSDKYEGDFSDEDEAILVQLAQMAAVAVENTQLYQALRDADRRKDEFLAMLAHELRNPLAPMQSALTLLGAQGSHSDAAVRLRAVIGRQMSHLTRLVDDLLDVARITSGKVALKREPVELGRVVAQAIETSRPLIDAKRHTLTVEVGEPIWLDADPVRLAQVISNLLNNAAKYTDDRGKICVSAHREADSAVIRVRDTGIGLSADMLPRVFELFTQASTGLARSAGGLGIGLTLVRKLVEQHGGSVSVSSAGREQGSEFVVRLPAGGETGVADAPAGAAASGGPKRVLLVDDNLDALETMSMLLEMLGHVVATASDGMKAVEEARSFKPEVMFLDLGLPGRDGYEVARILRQEFPRGTLWLVALTGYGQDEDRKRTRDAGFDQHLVKPVEPEELEAALHARGR